MEGIDRFGEALRTAFGARPFSVQDVIVAVPEACWPPSTRGCARQRSRSTSIGKALERTPGAGRLREQKMSRPMWRMLP